MISLCSIEWIGYSMRRVCCRCFTHPQGRRTPCVAEPWRRGSAIKKRMSGMKQKKLFKYNNDNTYWRSSGSIERCGGSRCTSKGGETAASRRREHPLDVCRWPWKERKGKEMRRGADGKDRRGREEELTMELDVRETSERGRTKK